MKWVPNRAQKKVWRRSQRGMFDCQLLPGRDVFPNSTCISASSKVYSDECVPLFLVAKKALKRQQWWMFSFDTPFTKAGLSPKGGIREPELVAGFWNQIFPEPRIGKDNFGWPRSSRAGSCPHGEQVVPSPPMDQGVLLFWFILCQVSEKSWIG